MRESAQTTFDRRMSFVCPQWLADAVAVEAKERMTSINSVLRLACAELVKQSKNGSRQRPGA
jgi:hypothetical protein